MSLEPSLWASLRINASLHVCCLSVPTLALLVLAIGYTSCHPTMVRGFPNHRQDPVNSTTRLFPHLWYFPPWPVMNRLIFVCLALPVWCFRQSPLIFTMFIFFQECTGTGSVNSDLTNLCHTFIPTPQLWSEACLTLMEVFITHGEFSLKRPIFNHYSLAFYGTSIGQRLLRSKQQRTQNKLHSSGNFRLLYWNTFLT